MEIPRAVWRQKVMGSRDEEDENFLARVEIRWPRGVQNLVDWLTELEEKALQK